LDVPPLLWTTDEQSIAAAFSAYERVIADVAIFSVRRRRQWYVTRRRNADTAITMTGSGVGSGLGFARKVPLGQVVIASHGGRCQHSSNDHSCRQRLEYGQGINPSYVVAQSGFSRRQTDQADRLVDEVGFQRKNKTVFEKTTRDMGVAYPRYCQMRLSNTKSASKGADL
jgi:hypothetical protein